MIPETPKTPETISGNAWEKESGNSGISIDTGIRNPEIIGALRILLGPSASKALTDTCNGAFIVIGKASHPDDPTRWALHLIPCPISAANDACDVAQGKAKATRKKPTTIDTTNHQKP